VALAGLDGEVEDYEVQIEPGEATNSISGFVYVDVNNNGIKDPPELGLPNVRITITGPVTQTISTDSDGSYSFVNLPAGEYTIDEEQPLAFRDGIETPGSPSPIAVEDNRFVGVALVGAIDAAEFNFGERGLRSELISKRLLFASTPPASELVLQFMGLPNGAFSFTADFDGQLTAEAEASSGATLELYTSDWMPVALGGGAPNLSATVAEGDSYMLVVGGIEEPVPIDLAIQRFLQEYFTNPDNPWDINGDGQVAPLDALIVVNALNSRHVESSSEADAPLLYLDANGDSFLSPLDALGVVNYLNTRGLLTASAEGESAAGGLAQGTQEATAAPGELPMVSLLELDLSFVDSSRSAHRRDSSGSGAEQGTSTRSQPSTSAGAEGPIQIRSADDSDRLLKTDDDIKDLLEPSPVDDAIVDMLAVDQMHRGSHGG
jgi:hypothetical protein